jgi:hypothetical protein
MDDNGELSSEELSKPGTSSLYTNNIKIIKPGIVRRLTEKDPRSGVLVAEKRRLRRRLVRRLVL